MNRSQLKIDIVSDVVCPWCAIGYKKLSKAMEDLNEEILFEVNWKPYELHPEIPTEGFNKEEYYKIKFGNSNGSKDRFNHITEEGKKPLLGYIASIKNMMINRLPKVGETILTEIIVTNHINNIIVVQGESKVDNIVVSNCELKVFIEE